MAIYISNAIYLDIVGTNNNPLIGWNSCFPSSGVSSPDTAAGFSAAAVWSADTYSYWQSDAAGSLVPELVFENQSLMPVDYMAFAGHNLYEAGASFACYYSNDGTTWISCDGVGARSVLSDVPVMIFFDAISAPYFKIVFTLSSVGDYARIAHVKIGSILVLQRPRYVGDTPGGMDIKVEKIGSKSYAGQHLGSVLISQGDTFNITQENNTPEFVRSTGLQNFFKHAHRLIKLSEGPTETFFYSWRPSEYPNEIQYCGETTSFDPPTNARSNGMMNWSMKGDAFR